MSWQQYVRGHAARTSQTDLAATVGVTPGTVSKWISGKQGIDAAKAIAFARGIGDDPLAALIAGGFLTRAEAKSRPAPAPDYSQLSNDELLNLVRERMREDHPDDSSTTSAEQDQTDQESEPEERHDAQQGPTSDEPVKRLTRPKRFPTPPPATSQQRDQEDPEAGRS